MRMEGHCLGIIFADRIQMRIRSKKDTFAAMKTVQCSIIYRVVYSLPFTGKMGSLQFPQVSG